MAAWHKCDLVELWQGVVWKGSVGWCDVMWKGLPLPVSGSAGEGWAAGEIADVVCTEEGGLYDSTEILKWLNTVSMLWSSVQNWYEVWTSDIVVI